MPLKVTSAAFGVLEARKEVSNLFLISLACYGVPVSKRMITILLSLFSDLSVHREASTSCWRSPRVSIRTNWLYRPTRLLEKSPLMYFFPNFRPEAAAYQAKR